jgi:methenyltetrahydromethanopterin cyclohydrolase
MKLTRRQLRKLIHESLNEASMKGKKVNVSDGNIIVDGESFGLEANAGLKTGYQFVNVKLTDIAQVGAGLKVIGSALGVSVDDLVPSAKVDETTKTKTKGNLQSRYD